MTAQNDARVLYDQTADKWRRDAPSSLSDFTGRPAVFELCEPVAGARVLDVGCGEGYCARELMRRGAAAIDGLDASSEMIALAEAQAADADGEMTFRIADATKADFGNGAYDLVIAVFLFNYLDIAAMQTVAAKCFDALKPGGRFVFATPHPAFPFLQNGQPPFYLHDAPSGYFSARDVQHPGRIARIDGPELDIFVRHKTFADYMDALRAAGFSKMPIVRELRATDDIVARDPAFFEPVRDIPLHLAVVAER